LVELILSKMIKNSIPKIHMTNQSNVNQKRQVSSNISGKSQTIQEIIRKQANINIGAIIGDVQHCSPLIWSATRAQTKDPLNTQHIPITMMGSDNNF